jgi:hypothetical protein
VPRLAVAEANLRSWAERVDGIKTDAARRHLIGLFVDRVTVTVERDEVFFDVALVFDSPEDFTLSNGAWLERTSMTPSLRLVLRVQSTLLPRRKERG